MTGKRIQIVLIVILLNLTCFLGVIIASAYLLAEDAAQNRFSVGGNETVIIENYDEVKSLHPGMTIDKTVSVKNTGANDCYIRVLALFSDSDAEEYAQLNINDADWQQKDDGYYYYNGVLASGQTTSNLFSNVSIGQNADNKELKGFEIFIYAESINKEAGGF